jgi:hypothetical protein
MMLEIPLSFVQAGFLLGHPQSYIRRLVETGRVKAIPGMAPMQVSLDSLIGCQKVGVFTVSDADAYRALVTRVIHD